MNSNINDTTLNTVIPIQIPLTKPTRFLFIKENYGHDSYKLYQYYEKTTLKFVRLLTDLDFLKKCKENYLIPKFLQFKVANTMLLYTRAYQQCQNILFKEEINQKKKQIKYLSMILDNIYDELSNIFPPLVMSKIHEIIDEIQYYERNVKYQTHVNKFQTLINIRYKEEQKRNNQRAFLYVQSIHKTRNNNDNEEDKPKLLWNFSNRHLTEEEHKVLEKGMSYNRLGNINRSQIISNVEHLFHQASGIQKESMDFKKWDNDPDDSSNKEVRVLEPRQLSLAADLKNATQTFFTQAELSIKSRKKKRC